MMSILKKLIGIKSDVELEVNKDVLDAFKQLEQPDTPIKTELELYKESKEYLEQKEIFESYLNFTAFKNNNNYPYLFNTITFLCKRSSIKNGDIVKIKRMNDIIKTCKIHSDSYNRFTDRFFVIFVFELLLKYNWIQKVDDKRIKWIGGV